MRRNRAAKRCFPYGSGACELWHRGCCTRCMIVSFLGTKGGTGTTTLAVNCAADIRRITNRSTVVVDLKSGPVMWRCSWA